MPIRFAVTGSHSREAHLQLLVAFGLASLALDAGPLSSPRLRSDARGLPASTAAVGPAHSDVPGSAAVVASGNAHPTTDSPEDICGSGEAGVIHRFS